MITHNPHYEVELKFRVTDAPALQARFATLGVTWSAPVVQCDRYFAHPARDFRQTDEALRIRTVGDEHWLTYKGPVIDSQTKTRREIEAPLASGPEAAALMSAALIALGFLPVRDVPKLRRTGHLKWQGRTVECAWDEVAPLGEFVELEIVTSDADRDTARDTILSLAGELKLCDQERRSYLQLIISHDLPAN